VGPERETWDADALVPVGDSVDVGDRVAVRFIWRGAGHGPEANLEMMGVFTVREARLFGIEHFWDQAEALETLRLSEQDAGADAEPRHCQAGAISSWPVARLYW
jgi:hypothetical protein